jgi:hypothetical protein
MQARRGREAKTVVCHPRKRRDSNREMEENKAKGNAGRKDTVLLLARNSDDEPKRHTIQAQQRKEAHKFKHRKGKENKIVVQ